MNPAPILAIVLVNWNRSDDTINCLQSIAASTFRDYFVVVVDNGSAEAEIAKLKLIKSDFILIETGENLGYTGGNNKGIERALELKADYLLLLNNDTLIAPDMLKNSMQAMVLDRRIGILTPKIFFHPARHLIWSAGATFDSRYMIGYLTGYKIVDAGQFEQERELEFASGCAMFIQSEVIRTVGMLCDDYFAVCEDLDYCLRTRRAGYKIKYLPSGVVWHIESASSGGHDAPQYVYYQLRNYCLLHKKWAKDFSHLLRSQAFLFLYATKRAFQFVLRGKWRSAIGIIYGIRDAAVGRLGRRDYAVLAKRGN